MLHIWTTDTYLDDGCYISGRLIHIWTMGVTYQDDCYIFGRWVLHIWTSATYLDDGCYISGRVLHIWTMEVYISGRLLHIWTATKTARHNTPWRSCDVAEMCHYECVLYMAWASVTRWLVLPLGRLFRTNGLA